MHITCHEEYCLTTDFKWDQSARKLYHDILTGAMLFCDPISKAICTTQECIGQILDAIGYECE